MVASGIEGRNEMKGIATALILIGIILTAGAAGAMDKGTVGPVACIVTMVVGLAILFFGAWIARRTER